jgi:hypothetical protein
LSNIERRYAGNFSKPQESPHAKRKRRYDQGTFKDVKTRPLKIENHLDSLKGKDVRSGERLKTLESE